MDKLKCMTVTIIDMNDMGQGVARHNDKILFVDGAVIGDVVKVVVISEKKNYAVCRVIEEVALSSDRKQSDDEFLAGVNEHYHSLGMSLYPLDYSAELKVKENKVASLINKSKLSSDSILNPIVYDERNTRYRNKGAFPVAKGLEGVCIGVYKRGSHTVYEVADYPLMPESFAVIIDAVKRFCIEEQIEGYDEKTHTGSFRQLLIRVNHKGEHMLVFVLREHMKINSEKLVHLLESKGIVVASVIININKNRGNTILGRENYLSFGDNTIIDKIGKRDYILGTQTFFQVNRYATEKLYDVVKSYASQKSGAILWDVYCGVGTIGIYLSEYFDKIMGVESVKEAVESAEKNAKLNNIENYYFEAGKAEDVITKWKHKFGRPDLVVLDPPRKGVERVVLETLADLEVSDIIYVSCKPSTLMRDVKILEELGYEAKEFTPCDLFPGTPHVETVALLSKLDVDKHISVEVTMDELDLTSAESKATYKQIKEYVIKNTGLKVSSLNIAQTKRKYGIIERENYNKSKNDNAKVPNCTEEKEKVIVSALKHFQMI